MPYDNDKVDMSEQINATEVNSNYKVFCVFSMCVFRYFTGMQGSKQ